MNGYKVVVSGHMASRDSESKAKIRKKATEKSDRPVIVIPPKSDDEEEPEEPEAKLEEIELEENTNGEIQEP